MDMAAARIVILASHSRPAGRVVEPISMVSASRRIARVSDSSVRFGGSSRIRDGARAIIRGSCFERPNERFERL